MTTISTHTHNSFSFSLRFLFLVTTFTAACCTLIAIYPGLGIVLAIVMMSAFARTCLRLRGKQEGPSVPIRIQLVTFLDSLIRAVFILFVLVSAVPVLCVVGIFIIASGMAELSLQIMFTILAVIMLAFLARLAWSVIVAIWCYIPQH